VTVDCTSHAAAPAPEPQQSPQAQESPQTQQSPAPGPDVTAPSLVLDPPSGLTVRRALRHGIRFKAAIGEASHVVLRAFVDRRTAHRLKINRRAVRDVMVGSLSRQLAAGTTTLRLTLSRKAQRRMRGATRVKLRIVATSTDTAGNTGTQALRITLGSGRALHLRLAS
jgi:hypothetical protein